MSIEVVRDLVRAMSDPELSERMKARISHCKDQGDKVVVGMASLAASRGEVGPTVEFLNLSLNVSDRAIAVILGAAFFNRAKKRRILQSCYQRTGLEELAVEAMINSMEDSSRARKIFMWVSEAEK